MTRKAKFEKLQDLVLDTYIEALENGKLAAMELGPIVTLLKNNNVVQAKDDGKSEQESIDSMVEDAKI